MGNLTKPKKLIISYLYKKILHLDAPYMHPEAKKDLGILPKPLILLVRQAGFEPAAYGFVVRRSIRAELLAHVKLS